MILALFCSFLSHCCDVSLQAKLLWDKCDPKCIYFALLIFAETSFKIAVVSGTDEDVGGRIGLGLGCWGCAEDLFWPEE